MTSSRVARSYAHALLRAANKKGGNTPEECLAGLIRLSEMTAVQPQLASTMNNPVFSRKEKQDVIMELARQYGLDQLTANFSLLLADKDRFNEINAIIEFYRQLLDKQNGILRGKLVTAMSLTDEQKQETVEQLEKQTGRKIVLEYSIAPEIIGGVMFEVGDEVLDASIRAQLSILKDTIKRGEQGHADQSR